MQTFHTAIEEFREADEFARLALNTRKRHDVILKVLRTTAGPSTPIARLSRTHIDAVLNDRRDNGVTERTINMYKSTLRMFSTWVLSMGYVKKNHAAHLKNVKTVTAKAKRKPLQVDQLKHLLKLATEQHPRDGATAHLLFYTGCRNIEIMSLRWRDVDLEEGTLSVFRSKVQDYHHIDMPNDLTSHLIGWKAIYEERHGKVKPTWFVVPALTQRGFEDGKTPYKMSPTWPMDPTRSQTHFRDKLKRLMRQVGVTDLTGKGTHTIRRTAANLLLDATGDIRAAQRLLGHASVTQTEQYLDIDAAAAKYKGQIQGWTI